MEKELGHPLRDGPSPTVEPVPVSPVPASVPDAWHPIETAPKDGTEMMLFDPSFHRFKIGSWREDDFMNSVGAMWLDDSYDDFSCGFCSCPLEPTHWMPLPTPPNNTPHPTHSETAQERPAPPASGAI